jgi:serine/threonine protein kinase
MKNEKNTNDQQTNGAYSKNSDKISYIAIEELEKQHKITFLDSAKLLGMGGFAAVFAVKIYEKLYAIKVINYSGDEIRKARIKQWANNEAAICNSLRHKNTVRAYCVYDLTDAKAIVLEMAINKDLNYFYGLFNNNKLFKPQFSHMSESLIMFFFTQMYNALEYLFQMDLFHGDIKLENFLLTRNFTIKLTDFALSVNVKSNNEFKLSTAGTTTYMAPEIFQGVMSLNDKLAYKIDYYALGCCLYRLLTGKHVVNVEADGKTVKLENLIIRLNEIMNEFQNPSELEKLILKLLNPNLEKRGDLSHIRCIFPLKNDNIRRNVIESYDNDYLKTMLELQKMDDVKSLNTIQDCKYNISPDFTYRVYETNIKCSHSTKIRKRFRFKN